MRTRKHSWLIILAAFALLVAACGDDDDNGSADPGGSDEPSGELEGTLRVLIHQNPAGVEFFEQFNDDFEAAHPGVTVDLSVVNADDLPTVNQTRLTADDIDVTTISVTGFDKPVQPYMTDVDPPAWQQLIDAGLLMDLSGEAFLDNYDDAAVESSSYNDGVYAVSLGRTVYSGMFVNLDLLEEAEIDVPTTWSELVSACDAVEAAGEKCMMVGGQAGWPVFVGTYGLLGALYPDQEGLVEDLWTGEAAWNDEQGMVLFERYAAYADMLHEESAGLDGDAAASRFLAGDVAFGPMGGWNASTIDDADFEWTYVPFPGSDDAADNQHLFGKIDMSMAVAADTSVEDVALAYLTALSDPDTYNAFANKVNYVPTQPTAELNSTLGRAISPILQAGDFSIGFEQLWVSPKGAGQWANAREAALWLYNGDFDDAATAANQAQSDLEAGL